MWTSHITLQEKKPWEPVIWNNLLILMMKKQAQRFEVISSKSQRSPGTSIYVISSRTGIRMDPYNDIFWSGLQLQKELFYTLVSDKLSPVAYFFHFAHSPWTTSSASHNLNYHPPLPFTNLYFQSCQTPYALYKMFSCSLDISYCCPSLSTFTCWKIKLIFPTHPPTEIDEVFVTAFFLYARNPGVSSIGPLPLTSG